MASVFVGGVINLARQQHIVSFQDDPNLYSTVHIMLCQLDYTLKNICLIRDTAQLLYVFTTKQNINHGTIIYHNMLHYVNLEKTKNLALPSLFLIFEYLLSCKEMFVPKDRIYKEIDRLHLPKGVVLVAVPSSLVVT